MNWVSPAQFQAFLTAAKIRSDPPDDIQQMLDIHTALYGAQDEFERLSNYVPFVATQQTRFFDPQGPNQAEGSLYSGLTIGVNIRGGRARHYLGAGLLDASPTVANPSPVTTSLDYTDRVGSQMTVLNDYWIFPQNAIQQRKPFRYVEFRYPQYGEPQSIQVTGVWGHSSIIQDVVMTAGSPNCDSTDAQWSPYDVGRYVRVLGAGVNVVTPDITTVASPLEGTVATYVSNTRVTLSVMAVQSVTGAVGFVAKAPRQVQHAVMARAAIELAPQIALYISKGRLNYKEGDVEATYSRGKGTGPLVEESAAWQDMFDRALLVSTRKFIK